MLRVGLTGGIACGKTLVGEMFARRGAYFVQADRIAHDLMRPGEKVYDDLVAHFGPGILEADGTISRPKLAQEAFAAPQGSRVRELNNIVHPAVIRRQEQWMDEIGQRDPGSVVIVEAALIFEARVEGQFDKIIVVTCDPSKKAARFADRAKVTPEFAREEVERRSAAQIADAEKLRRADYVIHNNGSLAETEAQVQAVWERLTESASK